MTEGPPKGPEMSSVDKARARREDKKRDAALVDGAVLASDGAVETPPVVETPSVAGHSIEAARLVREGRSRIDSLMPPIKPVAPKEPVAAAAASGPATTLTGAPIPTASPETGEKAKNFAAALEAYKNAKSAYTAGPTQQRFNESGRAFGILANQFSHLDARRLLLAITTELEGAEPPMHLWDVQWDTTNLDRSLEEVYEWATFAGSDPARKAELAKKYRLPTAPDTTTAPETGEKKTALELILAYEAADAANAAAQAGSDESAKTKTSNELGAAFDALVQFFAVTEDDLIAIFGFLNTLSPRRLLSSFSGWDINPVQTLANLAMWSNKDLDLADRAEAAKELGITIDASASATTGTETKDATAPDAKVFTIDEIRALMSRVTDTEGKIAAKRGEIAAAETKRQEIVGQIDQIDRTLRRPQWTRFGSTQDELKARRAGLQNQVVEAINELTKLRGEQLALEQMLEASQRIQANQIAMFELLVEKTKEALKPFELELTPGAQRQVLEAQLADYQARLKLLKVDTVAAVPIAAAPSAEAAAATERARRVGGWLRTAVAGVFLRPRVESQKVRGRRLASNYDEATRAAFVQQQQGVDARVARMRELGQSDAAIKAFLEVEQLNAIALYMPGIVGRFLMGEELKPNEQKLLAADLIHNGYEAAVIQQKLLTQTGVETMGALMANRRLDAADVQHLDADKPINVSYPGWLARMAKSVGGRLATSSALGVIYLVCSGGAAAVPLMMLGLASATGASLGAWSVDELWSRKERQLRKDEVNGYMADVKYAQMLANKVELAAQSGKSQAEIDAALTAAGKDLVRHLRENSDTVVQARLKLRNSRIAGLGLKMIGAAAGGGMAVHLDELMRGDVSAYASELVVAAKEHGFQLRNHLVKAIHGTYGWVVDTADAARASGFVARHAEKFTVMLQDGTRSFIDHAQHLADPAAFLEKAKSFVGKAHEFKENIAQEVQRLFTNQAWGVVDHLVEATAAGAVAVDIVELAQMSREDAALGKGVQRPARVTTGSAPSAPAPRAPRPGGEPVASEAAPTKEAAAKESWEKWIKREYHHAKLPVASEHWFGVSGDDRDFQFDKEVLISKVDWDTYPQGEIHFIPYVPGPNGKPGGRHRTMSLGEFFKAYEHWVPADDDGDVAQPAQPAVTAAPAEQPPETEPKAAKKSPDTEPAVAEQPVSKVLEALRKLNGKTITATFALQGELLVLTDFIQGKNRKVSLAIPAETLVTDDELQQSIRDDLSASLSNSLRQKVRVGVSQLSGDRKRPVVVIEPEK